MNKSEAKSRIEKLRAVINHHRYLYHVLDKQEISDEALDSLKHELKKLEDEFPEFITPDSPTQRVGGSPLAKFKKAAHRIPMLSLEDVFSEEEFDEWMLRVQKLCAPQTHIDLFAEKKFDGLALSLIYEKGILARAVTRGDGKVGEDVTQNARTIESIPLKLRTSEVRGGKLKKVIDSGSVEIRGEVIITKKEFERINREQKKKGLSAYANPRNLAAGSIRQLDSKITAERKLDFMAYDIVGDAGQKLHSEEHDIFAVFGFKSDQKSRICKNSREVFDLREDVRKKRDGLKYHIDGLVVTVDDNDLFQKLGVVGKAPRGSIAFKFAPEEAITVVEDILVQVGRTGVLTPVAVLRPVQIGGTTVSRATLHNEDEIERLGLKIGDSVIVGRAGDVIPDVRKVLKELRTGKERVFKMPVRCPVCGGEVKRKIGEAAHKCLNKKCSARSLREIYYFVSRQGFDIEGLGPKIVDALFDQGLIQDSADIFELKEGDLVGLERFAEKSAENLVKAIKAKKEIGFARFIRSLGILHVGEETAEDLAGKFSSLENLKTANIGELESVPNIGEVVARSIYDWFRDEHNRDFLKKLLRHISIKYEPQKKAEKLNGLLFVFTGTLARLSRDDAKARVRALSGGVSETVSKNTDFVVAGESPGSKYDKAKKLGVKIINEKELLKMIK